MPGDLWFVAEDAAWSGPFTPEEMRARVGDGRFARALVWKPGWTAWAPIGEHFPAPGAEPAPEPNDAEAELTADAPARRRWRGLTLTVWAMALAAGALGALLFSEFNYQRFGAAAAFVYGAMWIVAVLFVIAATVLTWRRAALPGAGWPWQVGKAVSAIAAIGALAFSVAFASMTVTVYNVSQARRTFATYELIYDPATRVITFSGPIGPGFADRLGGILSSNAGVRVLRIADSPGGLIDEAMSAAERIEREPGLAVEAAGECNSACFALFMAAEDRRAEYTAEFGFHRSGFVSDLPAFVRQAAESEGDGFRAYLIERGLPADRYDDWARSESLHAVSAIELRELRIVHLLLNGNASIEATQAKWLWIAGASEVADDGFAELARALAESREPSVLQAAGSIFSAARAQDENGMRNSIRALLPQLLPAVLESADPEVSIAYLAASSASIGYLVSMERWDECASVIDGRGMPENAIPNSIVRAELTALAAAVRSAADAAWVSRPLPSWAESAGGQAIDATIAEAARDGIDNTRFASDPRVRCLLTHRLLRRIERGEPTRSIVAYRWILRH